MGIITKEKKMVWNWRTQSDVWNYKTKRYFCKKCLHFTTTKTYNPEVYGIHTFKELEEFGASIFTQLYCVHCGKVLS